MLNNQIPSALLLIEDLGMQFATKNSKCKQRYGLYKCGCGKNFRAIIKDIKSGHTKSCGCYNLKMISFRSTTHGLSRHRIFSVWKDMIDRTNNKNHPSYKDYGARGITVCDRWINVANFIEDMYHSFEDGLSIDRRNNDGNYEPSNCRWVTKEVQTRNTRKLHKHNTSGYRGITYMSSRKKWKAQIKIFGVSKHLGLFLTKEDAAKAYDSYVVENNLEHTKNFS